MNKTIKFWRSNIFNLGLSMCWPDVLMMNSHQRHLTNSLIKTIACMQTVTNVWGSESPSLNMEEKSQFI